MKAAGADLIALLSGQRQIVMTDTYVFTLAGGSTLRYQGGRRPPQLITKFDRATMHSNSYLVDPDDALSNDDFTMANPGVAWTAAITTTARASGKMYIEYIINAVYPVLADYSQTVTVGITTDALPPTQVGDQPSGWGYIALWSAFYHEFPSFPSVITAAVGDVLRIAVDIDAGNLWFGLNGAWITGSPTAGTSPAFTGVTGTIRASATAAGTGTSLTMCPTRASQAYQAPNGFQAWG